MLEKAARHRRPGPRGLALDKTKALPFLPPSLGGWLTASHKPPGRTSAHALDGKRRPWGRRLLLEMMEVEKLASVGLELTVLGRHARLKNRCDAKTNLAPRLPKAHLHRVPEYFLGREGLTRPRHLYRPHCLFGLGRGKKLALLQVL